MMRIITTLLLAGILLLAACSTSKSGRKAPSHPAAAGSSKSTAPGAGSKTLATTKRERREASKRLRYLENGLEQWWEADQHQQYARRDVMASLMRTYEREEGHLKQMIGDLKLGSPRRRMVMAGALGFSGLQAAVPPLMEALRDQYYEVVLHALASLYQLGKARDVNGNKIDITIDPTPIIPFLSHPRADVRSNAALALSHILGPKSPAEYLVPLTAALKDTDAATRVHAVAAIGALGRAGGLPYVLGALQDPVELVRLRACLAIGRLKGRRGVSSLIRVLEKRQEAIDVKKAAARGLALILDEPITLDPAIWRKLALKADIPLSDTPAKVPPSVETGAVLKKG